ncbi:hypothetical protein [Burkholderia cepacia]|uniref:hypothetical protein n=1 Tax=Burkholderia cepacia TaxID=292 RepID=UPI0012D4814F|nr:hypothetical protein [Burkholderia cepacia]
MAGLCQEDLIAGFGAGLMPVKLRFLRNEREDCSWFLKFRMGISDRRSLCRKPFDSGAKDAPSAEVGVTGSRVEWFKQLIHNPEIVWIVHRYMDRFLIALLISDFQVTDRVGATIMGIDR